MTRLAVDVVGAKPAAHTAAPGIVLTLRIEEIAGGRVHAIALRCQTRIEPRGRRYATDEQARLYELFGDVSQWDRTLRGFVWANSSVVVPSFERRIDVDLAIPCTYDLEVASAKYFHAIRDGDVPLALFFSGSIFNVDERGLCVEPIPWDLEVSYRMPSAVWHDAMERFFPGGGWVRLQRDTIDRLQAFRGRHAVVTWDEAIDILLRHAEQESVA
jgi:hypothetical protein